MNIKSILGEAIRAAEHGNPLSVQTYTISDKVLCKQMELDGLLTSVGEDSYELTMKALSFV